MTDLAGRIALVTGGAGGIGRATAIRLAADGAAVAVIDLDEAAGASVAGKIEAAGGRALAVAADVTDEAAVTAALELVGRQLGPVDILVNNAGIGGDGVALDIEPAAWRRVLDVHVLGAYLCSRAVLPGMRRTRWGRIVNVVSDAVWLGNQSVPYVTAKGALLGFTRSLAAQVASDGILVNAVAPGPTATPMLLGGPADAVEAERRTVRIGRFLRPEEIAATIAFLAGSAGDVYVGQVLSPNGGTVFPG